MRLTWKATSRQSRKDGLSTTTKSVGSAIGYVNNGDVEDFQAFREVLEILAEVLKVDSNYLQDEAGTAASSEASDTDDEYPVDVAPSPPSTGVRSTDDYQECFHQL